MAYVPLAQELSTKYTLTSPDGVVAVLNDTEDINYVGATKEVTGLDSAEVREAAEDRVESDGGVHGDFYFGRRPVTMTVLVHSHATIAERSAKVDRLRRASLAMRGDSILRWHLSADPTVEVFVPLRRQQPFRESGTWNKELLVAMISEYAVIRSTVLHDSGAIASGGNAVLENKGNYPAYPVVRFVGTSTNPSFTDGHGGDFNTTGLSLASGETVEFDLLNHTGAFTVGARAGQSANRYIDFATTSIWPSLVTGNNTFTMSGGGSGRVFWRDAWA